MRVAIIGSGSVGKALGGRLIEGGHDVIFTAAHPENAEAAASELGGSWQPTMPRRPPRRMQSSSPCRIRPEKWSPARSVRRLGGRS